MPLAKIVGSGSTLGPDLRDLDNSYAGGRLSLSGTDPCPMIDATAQTTVSYVAYTSNKICLYDGTKWVLQSFTTQALSIAALPSSAANSLYDVWASIAGTDITLSATKWTSSGAGSAARATALAFQDGIYVKSGTPTLRYLGTIMTTSVSTDCEDSATRRLVWNYYNRVRRSLLCFDTTDSWTYATATTLRASNANTTDGVGRSSFIIGVAEDVVEAVNIDLASNNGPTKYPSGAIGINSTTVNSARIRGGGTGAVDKPTPMSSWYKAQTRFGYNNIQRLEFTDVITATFRGDNGGVIQQSGMLTFVWM